MKRVLFLTASTGAGHNQAAKSFAGHFDEQGYETKIIDFLKDINKAMDFFVADGYEFLANNLPSVYGLIYEGFDNSTLNSLSRYSLYTLKYKLYKKIREFQPDLIIGTHPFSVMFMCEMKRKQQLDCKFISIVTDFKAHYAYVDRCVDAYITGSEYTKQSLIDRGIEGHKVFPYGIPVRDVFYQRVERRTEIPKDEKLNVLVMGGSMGINKLYDAVEKLINHEDINLTVVCGKNEKLRDKIATNFSFQIRTNKLTLYGFTKEIPRLMDENDVIISKPGGITTTESLAKGIPMVVPFAIPGQEEENIEFITTENAGSYVKSLDSLLDEVLSFKYEEGKLDRCHENIVRVTRQYSIESIIELGKELANE